MSRWSQCKGVGVDQSELGLPRGHVVYSGCINPSAKGGWYLPGYGSCPHCSRNRVQLADEIALHYAADEAELDQWHRGRQKAKMRDVLSLMLAKDKHKRDMDRLRPTMEKKLAAVRERNNRKMLLAWHEAYQRKRFK